jgi:hypothetical protein
VRSIFIPYISNPYDKKKIIFWCHPLGGIFI